MSIKVHRGEMWFLLYTWTLKGTMSVQYEKTMEDSHHILTIRLEMIAIKCPKNFMRILS